MPHLLRDSTMLIDGQHLTTLYFNDDRQTLTIIDQTQLPHRFQQIELQTLEDACFAISSMQVRGAPLIGATAAFGMVLALKQNPCDAQLQHAAKCLSQTRPTAINLQWAINWMLRSLTPVTPQQRYEVALATAQFIREQDIETCRLIGEHGLVLIEQLYQQLQRPLNILTHCNAGWLATIDWGTALAPIYQAQNAGIPVHVWVDETRPRNQGASLTAYELRHQGIEHTVIADNVGGHLMQHGMVDLCIVGSDRTTARGDVCNKIGTYLKALAARDNQIPFYVALPASTIDRRLQDGLKEIPIEQRASSELTHVTGMDENGQLQTVALFSGSAVANYGFDVTPAHLVTGLITEQGLIKASAEAIANLEHNDGYH
jgi:methylthioribose-1-phosphate isomerase